MLLLGVRLSSNQKFSPKYPQSKIIPKHKEEATDDIREKGERG
jgi:hypothetical protein